MTRRELLTRAQQILAQNDVPFFRLEAELLLRHLLEIDAVELLARPDAAVTPDLEEQYRRLIDRRVKGEPSAYITGHREFYGLDFEVNTAVLIPRPDTEPLVENALEIASRYKEPLVADIGTGSGIIAVTLAKYLPEATVFATDISDEALAVARRNAQKHAVEKRITFLQGNLLEPLPRPVDIIVANLPYVTTVDVPRVNTIGFEPGLALHGGEDGLDLIKIMLNQVKNYLRPGACVLLEIGLGQREPLMKFIKAARLDVDTEFIKDLGGIERVVCLRFK